MTAASLFDFAVTTIFAREFLEGSVVIGEYRTIVLRSHHDGDAQQQAQKLRAIWMAALLATALALLVIAAVAIPLVILSSTLDQSTAKIIEGISKMVAGICLLQLSLKIPKFLGIYGSCKQKNKNKHDDNDDDHFLSRPNADLNQEREEAEQGEILEDEELTDEENPPVTTSEAHNNISSNNTNIRSSKSINDISSSNEQADGMDDIVDEPSRSVQLAQSESELESQQSQQLAQLQQDSNHSENGIPGLTLNSIRFNVAWNIWREVAECGVFLIPFFLSGENLSAIPLSAVVGSVVGLLCGWLVYFCNQRLTNKLWLAVFAATLLVFLSAGLFTGGTHNLQTSLNATTHTVWTLHGKFWDVNRLPMTVLKPFGYNDSRTVLEMCVYWIWLALSAALHVRKYYRAPKINATRDKSTHASSTEHQESGDSLSTHAGLHTASSSASSRQPLETQPSKDTMEEESSQEESPRMDDANVASSGEAN